MIDVGTGSITHTLHQIERLADDPESGVTKRVDGIAWRGVGSISLLSTCRPTSISSQCTLVTQQDAPFASGKVLDTYTFNIASGLLERARNTVAPEDASEYELLLLRQFANEMPMSSSEVHHELDFYSALTEPLRQV